MKMEMTSKKRPRRWLYMFLAIVVAMLVLTIVGWYLLMQMSIADYRGEIIVDGVNEEVEILFDAQGMPFIYAANRADLYYAIGWQHAAERLFQMELIRRVADGRLAEVFGHEALAFDKRMRGHGFARRGADEMPELAPHVKHLLRAYVHGINARIAAYPVLPPEFLLLDFAPREWTLADIGMIYLYQTWFSHALIDREDFTEQLWKVYGAELAQHYQRDIPYSLGSVRKTRAPDFFSGNPYPLRMSTASNAFVISAQNSESNAPLFAADPHLQVDQLPGFWYPFAAFVGDSLSVVGISTPGLPFIAMGHNGNIAWAFTVAAVDIIDYYSETLVVADSSRYLSSADTLVFSSRQEVFAGPDETVIDSLIYWRGRNGQVVEFRDSIAVCRRWAGDDFHLAGIFPHLLALKTCSDFANFQHHVTSIGALSATWLYADKSGNIGYQMGVPIPKRNYADAMRLLPGDSSAYHWQGYWSLAETPHALNPVQGWLAACNNQPWQEGNPPGFYSSFRINRASDLLLSKNRFAIRDLHKMQSDVFSPQVEKYWPDFQAALQRLELDTLMKGTPSDIARLSPDNRLATLFFLWWEALPEAFLGDELELPIDDVGDRVIELLLNWRTAPWVDDNTTAVEETWEDGIDKALQMALERDPQRLWGEAASFQFRHILLSSPLLRYLFSWETEPRPGRGAASTLNANFFRYDREKHRFTNIVAPSMRMLVDFVHPDSAYMHLNAGVSGHPYSPHFIDQYENWYANRYQSLPFTRKAVESFSVSRLNLMPSGFE
jgi:penicillin amidase